MSTEQPIEGSGDQPPEKKPSLGRRWRYFSRRHAIIAGLILGVGAFALLLLAFLIYRLGYVDRYIVGQIKGTFSNYGIRAEIREFHATLPPDTVEMSGIELFDAQTGEKLGKIDKLQATIRVEDLYALNLTRNINLRDLKIEGFEVWVTFDEQGRSNFRNIHIPPPEPNKRILFAYSTAHVEVKNGVVYYGDARHEISGEARNLQATIQPDDPNAPAESRMNRINFSSTDSTFTYDGKLISDIDIQAQARANQTRAEIQELTLKSPVGEARLQGTMDDWRALRYQMTVTSSVDLTQISNTFETSTALRGTGNFAGTVTGEGDKFKVEGEIKSDALAADGVRLQGLNANGNGNVQGRNYEINGRAVAALLNAGDFQLDTLQIVGKVMGTGTNFRWVGELRAVAERSYGTTIAGLILRDARAEMNDGVLTASSSQFAANSLVASGARVNGVTASDLRVRRQDNVTVGSVANVKAGNITASGAQVKGVTANKIDIVDKDGVTNVAVNNVQIGETVASEVTVGSLNIAGVRLSVRNRRIEGSTADIDAGTIKLVDGQAENVKLTKPVFVVEPAGSYRASADLSIGGGVLGQIRMGQAYAKVVATNREIQLNDFNADVFRGKATGNARIAIARNASSQVVAQFTDLDIAGPLTAIAGSPVPLTGRANGRVDLTFPGTNFKLASGTLSTTVAAQAGETGGDRIPITGQVALRANRGLFDIEQMNLQTPATTLKATGQFAFESDSNLQVDLNSTDAGELQAVLISTGLLTDLDTQLESYGITLAGQLAFNGTVRGKLSSPDLNGRFSLGSLLLNGNDVGSVSASITMNSDETRITDGRLSERDGGGVQFALTKPRTGENNTYLEATLDKVNAATILTALQTSGQGVPGKLADTQSDVSGQIKVTGIPGAMSGSADLRFGPGRLAGEPLESLVARATFSGSVVTVETVDARLAAGRIVGSGNYNTTTKILEFQGRAEGVDLARLGALTNRPGMPAITGIADFTADIRGNPTANDFSSYQIKLDGKASNVTINGRPAGDVTLVGRTENQILNVTLTSGLLGSPQIVSAQVNLAGDRLRAKIATTLTNADLTNLFRILLPQTNVTVSGRANGTLQLAGDLVDEDGYLSAGGLTGTATFSELSFRVEDIQLVATAPLVVRFTPGEIVFENARFTGPGTNIALNGTVATAAGRSSNLNVNGSLNLRVLNGVSPDFFSSGIADVAVRINGTFEQPRVVGTASLDNAAVSLLVGNERLTVNNVKSLLRFTANQVQIDTFSGVLGGGPVTASGGALLEGFTVARFVLNLHGQSVTVPFPEDFRSTVDADIEVRGSQREQLVSGIVNVRRTEYTQDIELADIINVRRESIEEGDTDLSSVVFSDLKVEGRNALVVRNNIADLVGSVSLRLDGPVRDPIIAGRITATSGTLNFRNDRYDITRALLDLPPSRNADPILNIQGESQIRGYRVIVSLTGPLSQPSAAVRSEPALPQEDVVSLITTGQLSEGDTSNSVLAQSGLGTATSLLTDALINAPAQRATSKLFGLTRFEINPIIGGRSGTTPAARLTLGRRISKEVTVTYSTNVTSDPNQILALEYRVSDRLSFVAQYEQGSTKRLSTRSNVFNFEIRFRKRF
ncbi:MAG TPA: translocation/assembly module TamB domain-containing protein [Pyrinomonadaceae bacterium]|nr:translocation/assembly module TamB domain-containing protein [Pyrinomonadaceae bacterium]